MEAQLTTPAVAPPPAFVAELDKIVAQAQAFEPLIESLVAQFIPAAAIYLPEIKAVLSALLSVTHKATGTASTPTAPPPTP